MVKDKLEELTERIERKEKAVRAERRASERRIERGEPEGLSEKARVTADEAKNLAGATKDFLNAKSNGAGSGVISDIFSDKDRQPSGGQREQEKQAIRRSNDRIVAEEDTEIITPTAALYSDQLEPVFSDVGSADTSGIDTAKDVRASIDIDRDGEIEKGEQFRPVSAPTELDEVPIGEPKKKGRQQLFGSVDSGDKGSMNGGLDALVGGNDQQEDSDRRLF